MANIQTTVKAEAEFREWLRETNSDWPSSLNERNYFRSALYFVCDRELKRQIDEKLARENIDIVAGL